MAGCFVNSSLETKLFSSEIFDESLDLKNGSPQIVSFVNPFSYSIIANKPDLINEIDYWFVDGLALCYLTNLRRNEKISRASFDLSSVAANFLNFASKKGSKIAVVGAAANEINDACKNLVQLFPNLNIVYSHHGYIKNTFESIYAQINHSGANYVIVGMGTPMQEEFSIGCKSACPNLTGIFTCGGFLTQTAMTADYYHPIIKKLGLRWLQRAYLHKHVRERLIKDYPKFIIRYLLNR